MYVFCIYLHTLLSKSLYTHTIHVRCTNIDFSIVCRNGDPTGSILYSFIYKFITIYPIFTSVTNNISNFAGGNNFSLAKSVLSNFGKLQMIHHYIRRKTLSISPSHLINKIWNILTFSSMRSILKLQYLK